MKNIFGRYLLFFVMLVAMVAGMTLPGLPSLPQSVVAVILAVMIFFACSKVSYEDIRRLNLRNMGVFYVSRFVILPLVLYFIFYFLWPEWAVAALLLSLMPSATAAPAVSMIVKGNTAYTLGSTVVGNFLAPFIIPLVFLLVGYADVSIDVSRMFFMLLWVIFLPVMAYALVVRCLPSVAHVTKKASFGVSTFLVGVIIAVVIAQQRHLLQADWLFFAKCFVIGFFLYSFYFVAGWLFAAKESRKMKRTLAGSSGANNNSLGVAVAVLHFTPQVVFFMVACEFVWAAIVPAFQSLVSERDGLN